MIPSLPEVVTEVLRLMNDTSTDIADFERPLRNDAALVARVLRLVNSPFYGLEKKVTTITEGVTFLGFRSLRSLVLATTTATLLDRDFHCYGHGSRGLWHHSVGVAAASRYLAQHLRRGRALAEEVFVAGLVHDIGKMLLEPYLAVAGVDVMTLGRPAQEVERNSIGLDHQEAGAIIAEKWNLSPLVISVLAHHHDEGGDDEYREARAIVRLADAVVHGSMVGYSNGVTLEKTPRPADLELLGLNTEEWTAIETGMLEAMVVAVEAMGSPA
ncbi:MAG: HDOD domain-containing protein [Planctomycetes bacterium]|nr:HDOD domain-containing protein [Planctomycetota bacterium]